LSRFAALPYTPGAAEGPSGKNMMTAELQDVPEKLFYKIGEVCQYTDTQPYVLRFWESEFPQLAPEKNRSGQRVYRRDDIELIFKIKKLLYEEEYTIAGARRRLEQEIAGQTPSDEPGDRAPGDERAAVAPSPAAAEVSRESRRLPLDDFLPDDPPVSGAPQSSPSTAAPAPGTAASDDLDALRREVHDLRAALARAEKSLDEAEHARLAAEQGRLAADEARRTAEDQREALRARMRRAATRVEEALARLAPEDTPR
jgi:DNA-binding transcriptional MerR regulator